jgi:hypothetical protein
MLIQDGQGPSEQEDRPHTRTQRALLLQPWWILIWWNTKVQYPLTVKRSTSARHLFVVRTLGTRKLILCLYALCTHFIRTLYAL